MRAEEIREMAKDDIVARIRELEEEQFRLKFRSATEPLEDPLRLRVIRRDIARLKTVLRESAGAALSAAAPAKNGGKRRTNA
jgi:large subunit ribosomal protein L29